VGLHQGGDVFVVKVLVKTCAQDLLGKETDDEGGAEGKKRNVDIDFLATHNRTYRWSMNRNFPSPECREMKSTCRIFG